MWEWQKPTFLVWLYSLEVCAVVLLFIPKSKRNTGKYCVYFHQVILQIRVSFSYCLVSQLDLYLQFFQAKNSSMHLGVVSTSFLLGEWDDCTGIYHSTILSWGSLLSPWLSIVATLPTSYQMHFDIWSLSWLRENQKAAKLDVMPSLKFASVFPL